MLLSQMYNKLLSQPKVESVTSTKHSKTVNDHSYTMQPTHVTAFLQYKPN